MENKWEKAGILDSTPDDRKEFVINLLDETLSFVNEINLFTVSIKRESDGKVLTKKELDRTQILLFPIIIRIANEIDITKKDVRQIYNSIVFDFYDFIDKNKELARMNIDLEAEYSWGFTKTYIDLKKSENNKDK